MSESKPKEQTLSNGGLVGRLTGIKLTYFVLFFGYGATLPYLALYFRQIGLNASYVGAIAGLRPLVQFISCPLWAVIADRFNLRRVILNMSIVSWLLFTVVLYVPRPKHAYCVDSPIFSQLVNNTKSNSSAEIAKIWPSLLAKNGVHNKTNINQAWLDKSDNDPLKNATFPFQIEVSSKRSVMGSVNSFQFRNPEHNHVSPRHHIKGSNMTNTDNSTEKNLSDSIKLNTIPRELFITQNHTSIQPQNTTTNGANLTGDCPLAEFTMKSPKKQLLAVFRDENECAPLVFYEKQEVFIVFVILITLTAVGEFFEAPAVSLLDVAILECLEDRKEMYGQTRLFGSLGFGISSFIVGLTLDNFHITICNHQVTDFMVTLYFFSGSMILAILISLLCVSFSGSECSSKDFISYRKDNDDFGAKINTQPCSICQGLSDSNINPPANDLTKNTFTPLNKSNNLNEIIALFKKSEYQFNILVSLFLGFSHGSIMNFINWFLEDLGASRLMMGSATVIRDFAVVFGFYISPYILGVLTQLQVITWTFCVYIFSYFCYSLITFPWYAVPVECIQGLAYAIMWSSCITYFGGAVSKENSATMQGVIQGVYWGLGTGSGAVIGGISVFKYGCSKSFQLGGYITCFAMLFFGLIYYFFIRKDSQ